MTTVEFSNGIKLPYLVCFEAQGMFGGIERKTLQFEVLRETIAPGELDALLCNETNLETIILKNDGAEDNHPVEHTYTDYVCYSQLTVNRSGNGPEEELISFTLGQRIQMEKENMSLKTGLIQK